MNRYIPAGPMRDAIAVYEAIKSRADKNRMAFFDLRDIATQTRLDPASVSHAVNILMTERLIECKMWPNALPAYRNQVHVKLTEELSEDLQPAKPTALPNLRRALAAEKVNVVRKYE